MQYLWEDLQTVKLSLLMNDTTVSWIKGNTDIEVKGLAKDSRLAQEGYMFFATKKNERYIEDAKRKGATVIVSETEIKDDFPCLILAEDVNVLLGVISSKFYGSPSERLHVAGITGTNGKTTTSYLIESILRRAGMHTGLIGTISHHYNGHVLKADNTTPGAIEINSLLTDMLLSGVECVVMEVSSHALDQRRVEAIQFDAGIFTNLTHDHLDYHGDFENYKAAKSLFFSHYLKESRKEKKYAILNLDDPSVDTFVSQAPVRPFFYSLTKNSDACLSLHREDVNGLELELALMGKKLSIHSSLVGTFNASNILAAALYGAVTGIPYEKIREGVEELEGVPGRLERVRNERGISIFIDYAHTPDALKKVLEVLNRLKQGRLIVIFGCGGDRDTAKRPIMGSIASRLADFSIITSDNPRSEEPTKIIEDIARGFEGNSFKIVENRAEAIYEGIRMSRAHDVLLVAGKGHENYQIVGDKVLHFSDRETIEEFLNVAR